ncbi:hypothetical protein BGX26_000962 [Mortierella sp. AD094]|nr:hypothetical protein BGX26_000962 [Mortierella sp. AD094]
MATYKQRTPYNRFNGRRSPEQDSTESFNINTYNSTSGPSHSNPTDEILVDQEWTSIRHSASARAKARQQQLFLHQEQQRAQEWHFVLEQHQRPSLVTAGNTSTFVQDDISSDEYHDDISDTESHSVVTGSRGRKEEEVALRLRARTRANSVGQSSSVSYSDLASESLEGLDESEDFSVWSQDEEDGQSYSTAMRSRNYIPISPSTISLSSTTSNNMIHPSSLAQSQMPFHDGSGNFTTTRPVLLSSSSSQQGSDHESDHGGWESSSSTGSIFGRNQIKEQNRRSTRSQQYALTERSRHPISSSEFDSVVNNIALFQARHSQKSVTGATEACNNSVPQIIISTPHTRIKRPLGPSKLSTCSIYESEMEDIDAMVVDLPSKQGWLETFESALNAIHSYGKELGMEDSTLNNPIKALAQHYASKDIEEGQKSSSKPPPPPPITTTAATSSSSSSATSIRPSTGSNDDKLSNMEKISSNDDSNNNAIATDMKKIRQQISASSLQSLQMRHRASCQDFGQNDDVFRPSVTTVSHNNMADPMQVQFTPTIMDRSAQGHDSLMMSSRASLTPPRMVDRQEQTR